MNEAEIKRIWKSAHQKYESDLTPEINNFMEITRLKVYGITGSMKPLKKFTILTGFIWVAAGIWMLAPVYWHSFSEANKFFLFSASLQVILTAVALLIYTYQLLQIYRIELDDAIVQTQRKLVQLKISTLRAAKILFLQLPFWTTFWWNDRMLEQWSFLQWAFPLAVTLASTILALWLFMNINLENRNRKWFKVLFSGKEWTPILQSLELLDQLDAFAAEIKK